MSHRSPITHITSVLVLLAITVFQATAVHGFSVRCIAIDGKLDDWVVGAGPESNRDVVPVQEDNIDAITYDVQFGYFYTDATADKEALAAIVRGLPRINDHLQLRFWLRFAGEPFSDQDETTLEVLLENTAFPEPVEQPELFSRRFRPTVRIVITGSAGEMKAVARHAWRNGTWVEDVGSEPLTSVAVDGEYLEGVISWQDMGFPYVPDPPEFEENMSVHVGFMLSLRGSRDAVGPVEWEVLNTHISSLGWGATKEMQRMLRKEE
jgi:hypothetical protein